MISTFPIIKLPKRGNVETEIPQQGVTKSEGISVYEAREDSYLLAKELKKFAKGKKVLDMGSGSGIQAISALEAGAPHVLAADINKEAVKLLKNKGINAVKSDLFSNIKRKFDIIIFNPPYLPLDKREDAESAKATAGGKKGDEIILKFLRGAGKHLAKHGIILLVVSSMTPQERILNFLHNTKFKKEILARQNFFMEEIQVWKIDKIRTDVGLI